MGGKKPLFDPCKTPSLSYLLPIQPSQHHLVAPDEHWYNDCTAMADPLSLAASVAGLVSLGLEVTRGISSYLDAIECRSGELSWARQQNDVLANTIDVIERSTKRLEHVSPDAAAVATRSLDLCKDSLNTLESFVAQLADSNVRTWRSRLKDKAAKLRYAFDRPKVQQLSARVSQTSSTLQLAVDGLGLSAIAATHDAVVDIEGRVPRLESGIRLIQNQLDSHYEASIHQMVDNTMKVSDQIAYSQDLSKTSFHSQQGHLMDIQDRMANIEAYMQVLALESRTLEDYRTSSKHMPRTVARLASKPAAFKELCEMLPSNDTLEAAIHEMNGTQSIWAASGPSKIPPKENDAVEYRKHGFVHMRPKASEKHESPAIPVGFPVSLQRGDFGESFVILSHVEEDSSQTEVAIWAAVHWLGPNHESCHRNYIRHDYGSWGLEH
ncbi:microtubule associated protein- variant [Apiospora arundinis]